MCLELNAHALILLMVRCREHNAPEQFLILNFTSQPAEELFRELRSMTTTKHTQVDFTMKEFGEKLRRAQMKLSIAYRNKDILEFPTISRMESKYTQVFQLPTDQDIEETIYEALESASFMLKHLGILDTERLFDDSLDVRQGLFEFVPVEDDLQDDCNSDVSDCDQPTEETILFEFFSTGEDREDLLEEETLHALCEHDEKIYDAEKLFTNLKGELNLKNSTSEKHTFKVKDGSGKVFFINKTALIWMLTDGRHRRRATRVARYMQPNANRNRSAQPGPIINRSIDEPLRSLAVDDWAFFEEKIVCHVSGFEFSQGTVVILVGECGRKITIRSEIDADKKTESNSK